MLNANEAKTMTDGYYAHKEHMEKADAISWVEEVLSPIIKERANSGYTHVNEEIPFGISRKFVVEHLTLHGYTVQCGSGNNLSFYWR